MLVTIDHWSQYIRASDDTLPVLSTNYPFASLPPCFATGTQGASLEPLRPATVLQLCMSHKTLADAWHRGGFIRSSEVISNRQHHPKPWDRENTSKSNVPKRPRLIHTHTPKIAQCLRVSASSSSAITMRLLSAPASFDFIRSFTFAPCWSMA